MPAHLFENISIFKNAGTVPIVVYVSEAKILGKKEIHFDIQSCIGTYWLCYRTSARSISEGHLSREIQPH